MMAYRDKAVELLLTNGGDETVVKIIQRLLCTNRNYHFSTYTVCMDRRTNLMRVYSDWIRPSTMVQCRRRNLIVRLFIIV